MKKGICISLMAALLLTAALWLMLFAPGFGEKETATAFRTEADRIQILYNDRWEDFQIRGVNIGTGYPGVFPNDYGIDEETYLRWFKMIAEMNANVIRVYKIQSPAFYNAFSRYNADHEQKLYLLQGLDFSDHLMYSSENVLSRKVLESLLRDTETLVDALHGTGTEMDWERGELHIYNRDASQYTLGYVLGVEWDEIYVEYICHMNPEFDRYEGEFLRCTEDANAFETFLAHWADGLMDYEYRKYGTQKLISFCNWAMTDPLLNQYPVQTDVDHGYVIREESLLDMEHIRGTDQLQSGLFAAYNVYPYFPEFLQAGPYTSYRDDSGAINPYRKYLTALTEHHSYPVVITEFGLPASRSAAYDDKWRNMDHGGLTEEEQGQYLKQMYGDIRAAGCAGAVVFSWQDEWYKTIWNDRLLSDPDGRADWCNAQSAESFFGILGFEPGLSGQTPYPDGSLEEWEQAHQVYHSRDDSLSIRSDEKYLYLLVRQPGGNIRQSNLRVALDITPKSGAAAVQGTAFDRNVDFLVEIAPGGKVSLLVQRYYDSSMYSEIGGYPFQTLEIIHHYATYQMDGSLKPDMPIFQIVTRAMNNVDITMNRQEGGNGSIHLKAGALKEGNANPNAEDYDSNADYFCSGDAMEIRIPWQLLNFCDPARRLILDDFRSSQYQRQGLEIRGIHAAVYAAGTPEVARFGWFPLDGWDQPQFHERLKASYYVLQEIFAEEGTP